MDIKKFFKFFKEKIYDKEITRKFFWGTMFLINLTFLKIFDLTLTLIALNLPDYNFREANPLLAPFIDHPSGIIIWTIVSLVILYVANFILWIFDKKKEKNVDILTFILLILILITLGLSVWAVGNNMYLLYSVLK